MRRGFSTRALEIVLLAGVLLFPGVTLPRSAQAAPQADHDGRIRQVTRGVLTARTESSTPRIHLQAGYTFSPSQEDPEASIPVQLRIAGSGALGGSARERSSSATGRPVPERRLIQFRGPGRTEDRELIESNGGRILGYIPEHAYLVSLPAGAAGRISESPRVLWNGPYHPAYKLSPHLSAGTESSGGDPGGMELLVQLFPDASLEYAIDELRLSGAVILETSSNAFNRIVRVRIAASPSLAEGWERIARLPDVAWIQRRRAPHLYNDQAQWVLQTNHEQDRRLWNLGLRGQGQILGISDSGIRVTHRQFFDATVPLNDFGDYPAHRKIIAYKRAVPNPFITFGDEPIQAFHGTHTAGTLAGNDGPNGNDPRDGMAKDARLYFLDGGQPDDGQIGIPSDLNDLFLPAYVGNEAGGARIMSNSWGTEADGDYDLLAMTTDQFAYTHPDFLAFFANGNDGLVGSVGSPATAKNIVSVGGTLNGQSSDGLYGQTSRGPTTDARFKPTLAAPAILSSASGANDEGYVVLRGTSMSTPAAAGTAALIRQYLTEGWYPTGARVPQNAMERPPASLIKAMLINSTDTEVSGRAIPNNDMGWGRIEADRACYFEGDAIRLVAIDQAEGLLAGEWLEYEVLVTNGDIPLKATLVWTDSPGSPAASISLVNDLDLVVSDGVDTFRGNVFSAGASTTGGEADRRNVEECVRVARPRTGTWTFRIEAAEIPFGPQTFALVLGGGLAGNAGAVQLDKPTYGPTETVRVRVIDLNASGTIQVLASSPSEPNGEPLLLTGEDGVFEGSLSLTLDPEQTDGKLSVSDEDPITIVYSDTDPAGERDASAVFNLDPPVISAVEPVAVSEADVVIGWETDRPSDSKVFYGTTPELGMETETVTTLSTAHRIRLRDLLPSTLYYFDVASRDGQGNETRDDNGGRHYTVTTDLNRDILLVIGDPSFTKEQAYRNALNRYGWTYSVWTGATAALPVVGDRAAGMAAFKSVIWQTGFEQYPPFSDAQRDSVARLNALGSRLAVFSHDVAWDFSDPTSPDYTRERELWLERELKVAWLADPPVWNRLFGVPQDPISDPFTTGLDYTPFREGASGDEVDGLSVDGLASDVWFNNDSSPQAVGIRWTGDEAVGEASTAVWGGRPRRMSTNCFEWAQINAGSPADSVRARILDQTLIFLIGRDHPTVDLVTPAGGQVIEESSVAITWTEQAAPGQAVLSRRIYFSDDDGTSWKLITGQAGPSPYLWDLGPVVNGDQYRIRVILLDDGEPGLSGSGASERSFTIARPGGDILGPVVLAGSVRIDPNPAYTLDPAELIASVTDEHTGNSSIAAAEWSKGSSPAAPGTGAPMGGTFGERSGDLTITLAGAELNSPATTLWVRARDAAGNWGEARSLTVRVHGSSAPPPARFAFFESRPNPFKDVTALRYELPAATPVQIEVFDLSGRRLRTLIDRTESAGRHEALWDGTDEAGNTAASGVYFYRFRAGEFVASRKLVLLK